MDTIDRPSFHPLTKDARADVCVVGAGIAGLTTAYLLAVERKSVIVLEDGEIYSGQTERTTAHLSNAVDDRYYEIKTIHGKNGSQLAAESHTRAIDEIEAIVTRHNIDCDFARLDGYLFAPPDEKIDELEKELEAAHNAGMNEVHFVPRAPWSSFDTGRCLRFPRQGQFHPLKYLSGVANSILELGGKIYTGTHAGKIQGGDDAHIETQRGPIVRADHVVVATNVPINDLFAIHTKQAPYLTYVIGARIPHGSVTKALYWDTMDPYHYIRLQPLDDEHDELIVGGEDHKAGQTHDQKQRWKNLEQWARFRFPMIKSIEYQWSGMVMETTDGLAFIGRNPGDAENVYIATGDSGMGMTHGTIAGILLTDLIMGRENPWSEIYDPSRKPVWGMAWKEFIKENANVAGQYVKDYLGGGDVSSVDEILPGHGGVVRKGLSKIACFRDLHGTLHERSAVCPHLSCIVHWNDAEKCWDCPCHGSRFDAYGEVLNGPANKPLAEIDEPVVSSRNE